MAFDLDDLVAACVVALDEEDPTAAVAEIVTAAVFDPTAVERSIGHLVDDTYGLLHRSPRLTIQHGIFPAGYATGIHDHAVAAVIGTWAGYEDNTLYAEREGRLAQIGVRRCSAGDVLVLPADAIHEVVAGDRWVAGFHVYLGDLRSLDRREWGSSDSAPATLDGEAMIQRWLPAIEAAGLRRPAVPTDQNPSGVDTP